VSILRKQFGARLREIRLAQGLTQEQLAEKASVSLNFLNLIERGQRGPSFDSLERLAGALRQPVAELFIPIQKKGRRQPPKAT
jgi:transcriptional regulator with XRE-family HTH domain